MFDIAIIGTGPAGLSAALTLTSLGKNFIWFGNRNFSEKIRKAEMIRNFPGLSSVSGEEMKNAFDKQIADMGIEITEKTVTGIYDMGDHYGILCNQESFDARAVILATGVEAIKPIEGELEYLGRGVSFCATCDGFLYKGKTIGVVSTSKEHEHEVKYLSDIAEKVYLVPLYKDVAIDSENIEKIVEKPIAVKGSMKAERLVLKNKEIELDGIFFLKSSITPSALLYGLEMEDGHIKVDRDCKTNLNGCFAAGDCTGRPYQYVKAAGEGNVAAHSAVKYLNEINEK